MDSQKCREKLEKMARQAKCLIESPYANGDPSGAVREELDVFSFALTVLDKWEKGRKLWAIEGLAHLEDDERIKSLESDLARMKGFMEKIRDEHNSDLWQELHAIKNIAKQALGLGE